MSDDSPPAKKALPPFLLAMLAGITAFAFLDVQVSLATIDPSNPTTWRNMAPQVRYYFIPVFAVVALLFAALADPILRRVLSLASLSKSWHFAALGLAYSTLLASLPLGRIVGVAGLVAGPVFAVLFAVLVRWQAGRHES